VHALGGLVVAAVDATRCRIECPPGGSEIHKGFWSFKDHHYALKYEVGVSLGKDVRIVHVSRAYRGAFADINISRLELTPKLPGNERVLMDKGYQDDNEPRFLSPIKERVGRAFNQVELEYNGAINSKRQIVERANKRIKDFGSMSGRWRHGHGHELHEISFTAVCKLLNVMFEYEPLNCDQ
jgi:hypothetical protein